MQTYEFVMTSNEVKIASGFASAAMTYEFMKAFFGFSWEYEKQGDDCSLDAILHMKTNQQKSCKITDIDGIVLSFWCERIN